MDVFSTTDGAGSEDSGDRHLLTAGTVLQQKECIIDDDESELIKAIKAANVLSDHCSKIAADVMPQNNKTFKGLHKAMSMFIGFTENPTTLSRRAFRNSSSKELGLRVERELEQMIDFQKATCIETKTFPEWSLASKQIKRPHRLSGWLMQMFDKLQWKLIAYQIPLIDVECKIHTRLDFLAYSSVSRKFVLIELKTGYDSNYTSVLKDADPRVALANILNENIVGTKEDSFETRHQLQLAITRLLLINSGMKASQLEAYVVRASNKKGIKVREPQKLKKWAIQSAQNFVDAARCGVDSKHVWQK